MEPVTLRLVTESDAEALSAIYAPFVQNTAVSFEYDAPDAREFARRIAELRPDYPYIAAAVGDALAGYAYAHRFAARAAYGWCAETSIYLDPAHCGKGIGRALYGALLELLTLQRIQVAYAGISLPNPASVALQRSFGFQQIATYTKDGYKHGRWIDTATFEKHLGAHEIPPAPVIPFAALPAEDVEAVLLQHSRK